MLRNKQVSPTLPWPSIVLSLLGLGARTMEKPDILSLILDMSTLNWEISNFPKDDDLVWRVQVAKGEYIETEKPPVFNKLAINVNRKNYEIAFGGPPNTACSRQGDSHRQISMFSTFSTPAKSDGTGPAPCG